ncbi:MAG: hypothetical protein ACI89J_002268 [Hyphomicrobiaceae bacterium]|jgi:hypothetical protein
MRGITLVKNDLLDDLVNKEQRETSGSDVNARFTY